MRWREVPCATAAEYLSHTGFRLFHAGGTSSRPLIEAAAGDFCFFNVRFNFYRNKTSDKK